MHFTVAAMPPRSHACQFQSFIDLSHVKAVETD
jgi:hypothetical protein